MRYRQRQTHRMHFAGFWLAVAIAALQGINATRTIVDPVSFAVYMGLPFEGTDAQAWVQVYGLRAAFIALLSSILLMRRDFAALRWTALAALVMPLGDAWLASQAGAPGAIVVRHLGTAIFLIVASYFLNRAARTPSTQGNS